jgi:probable addiction module antidote protein
MIWQSSLGLPKSRRKLRSALATHWSEILPPFTAALMKLVKARGMTSVARKTGVSRHTLYRYEWGEDRPLLETALKMTAACGFKFTIVPSDEVNAPSNSK